MTEIVFVRHGEVHNPHNVYYGRLPNYRLSARGEEQAQAAGKALNGRPLAALFSSPQQRAQETAGFVRAAQPAALPIQTTALLNEVYSPWDGTAHSIMEARGYDLYSGSPTPYEQPEDLVRRVRDFWAEVRRDYAGQRVVAVTHGDIIAFAILWAKGCPLRPEERHYLRFGFPDQYPAHASLTTFMFSGDDEKPQVTQIRPY
ncbi:MAG: histidine phosphatase family protein [Chloroflexi bacterium]|nr:histidine phosphatase family protein [Chloroflexota bacterium]